MNIIKRDLSNNTYNNNYHNNNFNSPIFQINYIGEILHEVSTLDQTGNLNRSCSHHLRHFDLSLKVITKESSQKVEEISFEDSPLKLVSISSTF